MPQTVNKQVTHRTRSCGPRRATRATGGPFTLACLTVVADGGLGGVAAASLALQNRLSSSHGLGS
jgi:hypothetical protein